MAEVLEAIMLICFGLSWPINAYKAYKAHTAVGTSWQFMALISIGYVAGIAAKFVSGTFNWVLAVYFINVVAVGANWAIYARNLQLDRQRGHAVAQAEARISRRGGLLHRGRSAGDAGANGARRAAQAATTETPHP